MLLRILSEGMVRNAADKPAGADGVAPAADAAKPADTPAVDAASALYADDKPKDDAKPDAQAKPEDVKADDPKADDKAKADAKDGEKPAEVNLKEVPEDGKYDFTLPDGVEIDADLAAEAMPVLKDAGVDREGANKLAAFIAKQREKEAAAVSDNWDRVNREWQETSKKDLEIGGDKFDASLAAANKVVTKFGTPEFREWLTASGGGNHPEMIRLLARVGNAISDDKPVGSKTVSAKADIASTMYPND
jgi:hypothetical protein